MRVILPFIYQESLAIHRASQTKAHIISQKYVRNELEEAGFEILKEVEDFRNWKLDEAKPMWILVGVREAL